MTGVGEAASVIAIIQITQSVVELCLDYFGAIKDAQNEIRRLQHELTGLHEVLKKVHRLFEEREQQFPISREFKQTLDDCQSLVDELKNRLETKKNHFLARLVHRSLQWPFTRKELNIKIQHLHTIQKSLATILTIEQAAVSEKILERVDFHEKVSILDWISSVPYGKHHASIKDARVRGTCEWLLQHDNFCEWINTNTSVIMWLYGSPGAGKTFLASKVIDEIERGLNTASNQGFAFFYCNRNEASRREPLSILRSYVRQLSSPAGNSENIRGRVRDLYRDMRLKGSELGLELCKQQILESVNSYDKTTLVLDALDECDRESRSHLLDTVERLLNESTKPVQIFISSRPNGDIRSKFENKPNIELQARHNKSDIQEFVQSEIVKHSRWKDMPFSLRDDIIKVLQERSDGMFQWADLQIKQLLELYTEEAIRDRLGKLPDTLEKAYNEIYGKIKDKNDRLILDRAVKWVACAFRPLTSDLLLSAICLDPCDTVRSKITESALLDLSRNLLVIDSERAVWRFSHLSVTEYFEMNHWGQESAHCYIAKVCLRLLIDTYTEEFYNSIQKPHNTLSERNFIREYARDLWVKHVQTQEEQKVDSVLANLLKKFLGSPEESSIHYRGWTIEIRKTNRARSRRRLFVSFDSGISHPVKRSILAMCYFSFYTPLQDWWESAEIHVSEMADSGRNVLCIAADAGNRKICEALVKRGMNVNQRDRRNGSALAAAALNGYLDVVKFLIEHGANINQILTAGRYGSALAAAAARYKNTETVQYLVQHGADVNRILTAGQFGSTLAAAAVEYKNTETVQYLVQHGADVNQILTAGQFGSALAAAVASAEPETVQYLVQHGADVNQILSVGYYGSALAAAAAGNGNTETVQYLVQRGADVNQILSVGYYGSALAAAAASMKPETVQYLVQHGADVNQILSAGYYGSALAAAAAGYGNTETVQYLVQHGANLNQILTAGRYGSALAAAAAGYGNTKTVKYLVQHGADVNQILPAGYYGSALAAAAAARYDNTKTVEYLVQQGADINQMLQAGIYGSALSAAAAHDTSLENLKYLIKKRADINMMLQNKHYGSALATAAHWGNQKCVEMLIRAGADINLKLIHGEFRTALHAAQRDVSHEKINEQDFIMTISYEKYKRLEADKLKVVELLLRLGAVEEE